MAKEGRIGLTSTALRYIAMVFMLLDHMWATLISGNNWMTYVGRMAMPIFAFLVAEGYVHTGNLKKYKMRLFLFGILSEIPFNLMAGGRCIFPFHQNIMFTLLIGLLVIERIDAIRKNKAPKEICKNGFIIVGLCILSVITFVDYNITGVLTVVLFYVLRRVPFAPVWQLVGMVLINIVLQKGMYIPITIGSVTFEFITQGFAVFSLLFIWFYNGKKGCSKKWVQYFAYVFYPLHMLVLYMIWLLV